MAVKYKVIKEAILSKILEGTIIPHKKIGSESELMKKYKVSRQTVRMAIGELVSEGWLYRRQGAGTFCADRQIEDESVHPEVAEKNIAIISTYISDYIFPSIIRGAESFLSEQGYQVSIFNTDNDFAYEKRSLETILARNYDGIIIEPTKSAISNPNLTYYLLLENTNIPYIMINAYYDELDPLYLAIDDEKGGYIQTEHLIKLGHQHIIGVFKTDDEQGTRRLKGYLKAHRDYDIPINPMNIITYNTEEKEEKPFAELQSIIKSSEKHPTGLVCYNDQLALRLLDILRGNGIQVPDDISIVGYDDSFLAEVSEVKLTTIKHPKSEMGEKAAQIILDMIRMKKENGNHTLESYIYEPQIVIRNSTKKLALETVKL